MSTSRDNATLPALSLLAGAVIAFANVVLFCFATQKGELSTGSIAAAYLAHPTELGLFVILPMLLSIVLAQMARSGSVSAPAPAVQAVPPPTPAKASPDAALRLLGILQQEGRLIDFLEEDVDAYNDAQVGAASRTVHAGCRAALRERMTLTRIRNEEDGARIEVPDAFDPAEIRLIGNVQGKPPFHGTLQHTGWRASNIRLPESSHLDPHILAPAEVEIE